MTEPILSVCLITYNQQDYITEALDSILNQVTNFEWKLIIADDFSTDNTRQILQSYKKKYPDRITLILQNKNVGPEKNWLELMNSPKSKYVLYVEGDDYFSDNAKLQLQVNYLEEHNDFAMCFHAVTIKYQDGSHNDVTFPSAEERFNKSILNTSNLLKRNFIQTNSVMYRWRFVHESLMDVFPKNIVPGDWFLHLLHAQQGKIGYIDRAMSVYRKHPGGIWWDIADRKEKIFVKYSTSLVRFYDELLKVFKDNEQYQKIINGHIYYLIGEFAHIDNATHSNLVELTLQQFPELLSWFVIEQKEVTDKEIVRLTKDISELKAAYAKSAHDYEEIKSELHRITYETNTTFGRAIEATKHPIKTVKNLHHKK